MTREDKIKAFAMRLDGASWRSIAAELGCTTAHARDMILDALRVNNIEEQVKPRGRIVYPAIAKYLSDNHMSISTLSKRMGVNPMSPNTYNVLYGYHTPRRSTLKKISAATGIPVEQLIREEDHA